MFPYKCILFFLPSRITILSLAFHSFLSQQSRSLASIFPTPSARAFPHHKLLHLLLRPFFLRPSSSSSSSSVDTLAETIRLSAFSASCPRACVQTKVQLLTSARSFSFTSFKGLSRVPSFPIPSSTLFVYIQFSSLFYFLAASDVSHSTCTS